ncbi:MAG: hypothetical protein GF419_01160 [Ignavibacteriales bacterium]|nr:hypothetical protein [Ignavibacteriales bacterium]
MRILLRRRIKKWTAPSGASLCGASLCGASLCGASLCGASLCGARKFLTLSAMIFTIRRGSR